jgi:hypothetical protein
MNSSRQECRKIPLLQLILFHIVLMWFWQCLAETDVLALESGDIQARKYTPFYVLGNYIRKFLFTFCKI